MMDLKSEKLKRMKAKIIRILKWVILFNFVCFQVKTFVFHFSILHTCIHNTSKIYEIVDDKRRNHHFVKCKNWKWFFKWFEFTVILFWFLSFYSFYYSLVFLIHYLCSNCKQFSLNFVAALNRSVRRMKWMSLSV